MCKRKFFIPLQCTIYDRIISMKVICIGFPKESLFCRDVLNAMIREKLHLALSEHNNCSVVVLDKVGSRLNEYNADNFFPQAGLNLDKLVNVMEEIKIEPYELEKPRQVFPHANAIKQLVKSQCQNVVTTFRKSR